MGKSACPVKLTADQQPTTQTRLNQTLPISEVDTIIHRLKLDSQLEQFISTCEAINSAPSVEVATAVANDYTERSFGFPIKLAISANKLSKH